MPTCGLTRAPVRVARHEGSRAADRTQLLLDQVDAHGPQLRCALLITAIVFVVNAPRPVRAGGGAGRMPAARPVP